MAVRRKSNTWGIADELKGRTLGQMATIGISITFQCSDCEHTAVWPWPWMRRERRLQPLMTKTIDAFAPKIVCVMCGSRCFYVRPYMAGDGGRAVRR